MVMLYQPRPGNVVMCDYRGFVIPEMVKVRPVVVIARNRKNRRLVTVVPLSTTEPDSLEDHHHPLAINPLPGREDISCWAKCDMVTTVSLGRLDRYKVGRGQYAVPMLPVADFEAIRRSVANALDLTHI
ncbi:MAG: type II toxin-antitoxin system PemK/MazF family toxin [Brevundimonas sp.]|nr:type II toxin-antitoxin system PemK/MazF family toxin [Brevundimonas sp.]MDZ4060847.1 type II toxin-antitoxin system PemK/MazF family toxin [Brevundimonas sp.]